MFWKTPNYKQLERLWYGHLKDKGFRDIELGENLKQSSIDTYKQASRTERYAKQEYYLMLSQYLAEKAPEFDDSIDYFVMHKFALGWSNARICRELLALGRSRHRKTVMFIRRRYENRWNIRKWLSHQLQSQRAGSSSLPTKVDRYPQTTTPSSSPDGSIPSRS